MVIYSKKNLINIENKTRPSLCLQTWLQQNLRISTNHKDRIYIIHGCFFETGRFEIWRFKTWRFVGVPTEHQAAGGVPEGQRQGIAEKNPRNRHYYNAIWNVFCEGMKTIFKINIYLFPIFITKRLNVALQVNWASMIQAQRRGGGGVNTSGRASDVWKKRHALLLFLT